MSVGQYRLEVFPLQFALYLEGIRVPFTNATVTSSPNSPATCTIGLPPFASATRIRDRTLVDLFYLDSPFVNQRLVDADGNINPTLGVENWRLLFTGEVSHVEVDDDESSRTVNLICLDLSNYWNHCYQFFINNQRGMSGAPVEIATFVNGLNALREPIVDLTTIYNLTLPGQGDDIVFKTILSGRRNTILAGLADLLVKIGGEQSHIGANDAKGINRFFRDAELRLRMARRTFFIPDLQLANLMLLKADSGIRRIMGQISGELGGLGTVADVVRKFMAYAFYDYVNILAPPYAPNPSRDIRKDGTTEEVDFPDNLPLSFSRSVILSTMLKPKTFFLPPPRCNVFYPSRLTRFKYRKSFLDAPTRLRLKVVQGLPGTNVPMESDSLQELAVYAPPQTILNSPKPLVREATDTLAARTAQESGDSAYLDAWADVVREYGFYPDGANLNFDPSRDLSEPESGIVPVFDTMDYTQALSIGQLVAAGSNPATDTVQSKIQELLGTPSQQTAPDTPDDENIRNLFRYYLATANYQLDVRRFAQRHVSDISGPFNPNLIVGFPAAILSSTTLILGELASVSHNISDGAVTTSAFMSHARHFPIPSFLTSLSPEQLEGIAFTFGGSNSFRNDPITGDRVSSYKSPVDGSDVEYQDRNPSDFPSFLNNKFTSSAGITANVYAPIFDTVAIFRRVAASGGTFFEAGSAGEVDGDQYAAAMAQYIDYLKAPDQVAFVNYATRRNVTTIDQVRAHFDLPGGFRPVYQEQWHLLSIDEYLYGGLGQGPVFKALNGVSAIKQAAIQALTKDMRIALGKQPGVNMTEDINTNHHRSGGSTGV